MNRVRSGIAILFLLAAASCADTPGTATGPEPLVLGSARFFAASTRPDGTILPSFAAGSFLGANPTLFDTIRVDTMAAGRVFQATTATDTDFVKVAATLANGAANTVCAGGCDFSCSVQCTDEKTFFGLGANDFAPGRVEEVDLRVDSVAVVQDPLGNEHVYYFTVSVFGAR